MMTTLYKHKNNTEVAIELLDEDACIGCGLVKVRWWNIANGPPFPAGYRQGFAEETILIKDPDNWEKI